MRIASAVLAFVSAGTLVLAGTGTAAIVADIGLISPAANAAERNYEAEICSDGGGYDLALVNVGGYNQNNNFVHTPNFRLTSVGHGCNYKVNWWFKPNQTIEINARMYGETTWHRFYRNFAHCAIDSIHTSARMCYIW
ncbi:hypothetical protein [Actinoallomurus iriomotensis]|uniref:Uncharacterized protein n=1 Tax=Actinoallomurus iriomotensis TaxID=478107 RepID=A0A9W6VW47_9ACTN|nr:hypothetical protein [Actinoallomurus iriomotensis]GLY80391.1 hypothetical protein Airi01_086580 [Actinoallomurus iriomotensis]